MGYTAFRSLQEKVVTAVGAGQDMLVLMPTGGGKSLCFQLPTLCKPGLCLVVSPLIALMQDQVRQLQKRGIPAVALHSGLDSKEIEKGLAICTAGQVKFLYLSPERLQTASFVKKLATLQVSLVAIDEAHCIAEWGHDFRPAYLQIAQLRKALPHTPVIALTATATKATQHEIVQQLQLRNHTIFQQSFARSNLAYKVVESFDKEKSLIQLLKQIPGCAIVYAGTRSRTESITKMLTEAGVNADFYHAGLMATIRSSKQDAWITGAMRVMVATNAFGMGIDKAEVRLVVHMDIPISLEAYYQEAGRAGRDGQYAEAILLYEQGEVTSFLEKIQTSYPTMKEIKAIYKLLAGHYQIVAGSHTGVCHPFDLINFSGLHGLHESRVQSALARLVQGRVLQYDASHFKPAQVQLQLKPRALYHFQVQEPDFAPLIRALLDQHDHLLFEKKVPLSLTQLARELSCPSQLVERQLCALRKRQVLHYSPEENDALLTFLQPFQPNQPLPINKKKLVAQREIASTKAEAVRCFINHQHRCRPQLLLEYFSEVSYVPCGICDICLFKKTIKKTTEKMEMPSYEKQILQELTTGAQEVGALLEKIAPQDADGFSIVLQKMLELGSVGYDDALHLVKN